MLSEPKSRTSLFKYALMLIALAIVIGLGIVWLQSSNEAAPPMTEHTFDSGHAIWSIADYPAKALHENRFEISLTDQAGAPLEGATLSVKLDMVNMICGDYAFAMTEVAPGKYAGEGVPLMAGTWKATLTLDTKNKEEYTIVRLLRAVH
ncbi:FixH family protein [Paenibacillus paridis]|uniref:FixH family protein n=1 Tax=Paenibacillus paridis TaxID=2583376 RepID=UPI001121F68C|nr:FixH family protein [Paenibacillus paridis]